MKAQRFEIGQAVTPKVKNWHCINGRRINQLAFGEIYHVKDYEYHFGKWFISLLEIDGNAYDEFGFDPVISTNELESALIEIEQPVTV